MIDITISGNESGYYCSYFPHAWSETKVERNLRGYNILYSGFDPDPNRSRHKEPERRIVKKLGWVKKQKALDEALRILKRNVSGIFTDDVNFSLN